MNAHLIAPCGMDCSTCSGYLAFLNGIPKKRGKISHCSGCRPRNKQCAYLKGQCVFLRNGEIEFCFECLDYPCERLSKFDRRYRTVYGTSPIGNLEKIRSIGVEGFIRQQQQRYGCTECGGRLSVHNKKCFHCQRIVRWNS